jgi:putative heme iron utilization protein
MLLTILILLIASWVSIWAKVTIWRTVVAHVETLISIFPIPTMAMSLGQRRKGYFFMIQRSLWHSLAKGGNHKHHKLEGGAVRHPIPTANDGQT